METKKTNKKLIKNQDTVQFITGGLDKTLFIIVAVLLLLICVLLTINLYLQWNNYNQGIKIATEGGVDRHDVIITYSRAMDFAFIKTSTIFLGFVLVFVGALYVLRLNEVSYSIGINKGDANVSFQTASPGLVLVTLGVIMIVVTTYNKSYISLQAPPSPALASQPTDIKDIVKNISFKYDSADLTKESTKYIEKICSYMKKHNVANVTVEAHGDGDKSNEYEMALGERRSMALKNILQQKCSYIINYKTISYGEERPVARNEEKKTGVFIKLN